MYFSYQNDEKCCESNILCIPEILCESVQECECNSLLGTNGMFSFLYELNKALFRQENKKVGGAQRAPAKVYYDREGAESLQLPAVVTE